MIVTVILFLCGIVTNRIRNESFQIHGENINVSVVILYMYELLRERQMKSFYSETEVFRHCEFDSGFCIIRIHSVEFVMKS